MSANYLRLRQICLVAPELAAAERVITDVLGLTVCYRDPHVGKYGLENAIWPVGDMFLEVVAPTRPDTAAGRFLARSAGRGGYMVIFDCSDPGRRASHAKAMGVRVVTEITHDAYTGVQLHPRDCRAAMIEFNRTQGGDSDPDLYAPAGPHWLAARDASRGIELRAVELSSPDPAGLAAHWSAIIEAPPKNDVSLEIPLPESTLRFVPSDDGGERLETLTIGVPDRDAVLAQARNAGLQMMPRGFHAVGVEWNVVA